MFLKIVFLFLKQDSGESSQVEQRLRVGLLERNNEASRYIHWLLLGQIRLWDLSRQREAVKSIRGISCGRRPTLPRRRLWRIFGKSKCLGEPYALVREPATTAGPYPGREKRRKFEKLDAGWIWKCRGTPGTQIRRKNSRVDLQQADPPRLRQELEVCWESDGT